MINLEAFGRLRERQSPLGYVWHRDIGSRVLIVIDDWYDIPVWESDDGEVESSHAYGLTLLRNKVSQLDTTRAIGFFALPDPGAKDYKADIQYLIEGISNWLLDIKDSRCRGYMIVDYYYGEGFNQAHQSGTAVVEHWKSQESVLSKKLSMPMKLSHISIGGTRKTSNPYGLEIFRKTEMNAIQELPEKLRQWLDMNEHPLDSLWHISQDWFLAGYEDDDVMKHTTGNIQEYLEAPEDGRLATYRHNVESAVGLSMPDSWWQSPESVGAIHESLKCLCGALCCGQCDENTIKRPISTGATFLIALMAHQKQCGDIEALTQSDNIWNKADKAATSFVFAKQDCHIAQASAIALYDCFRLLFEVRDKVHNNGIYENSQVKKIMFSDRGRFLRIELSWNSHQKTTNCAGSLSERMTNIFQGDVIRIPDSPPKNTREAMLRLWNLMAISEDGCFSPGVLYLENNLLTIGSVK
ncbi:MAG: hypothetical protein AAF572_14440 [Cyanobacteria bacterium P01_B01_bin.77]